MLSRIKSLLVIAGLIFMVWLQPAQVQAEGAVVRAVLFYSPNCGHCHFVISETLPPLFEKYGEQLQMIGVDISSYGGSALFESTIQRFEIQPEHQGVPMLILGEHVLMGSLQIPEQFPVLIERYLAEGGLDWPDIPGLREAMQTAESEQTGSSEASSAGEESSQASEPAEASAQPAGEVTQDSGGQPAQTPVPGLYISSDSPPGIRERLGRDPAGNFLAIIVLVGMLGSLTGVVKQLKPTGMVLAFSRPTIWIPILCLVGILVAGYLAYVETTHVEAVCGPVGDCNTVQQSEYAHLFGFLPVGVLGLAGYVAVLAAWLIGRFGPEKAARLASLGLLSMSLLGVLFSVYLTFLEPFVIGATCAWCLTSAVIMTLLLWLCLAPGKTALSYFVFGEKHAHSRTGYRSSIQSK
jgi:uncharacterized membrane protein